MDFFTKKKDDIDDDPTDFSQPLLQALDASLRCPICKEFYRNPVITPCNHSFCSACIRVSLELDSTEKRTCPICATKITSEKDLRANGALEDIVDRYNQTRPLLLELSKPPSPQPSPRKRRKPIPSSSTTARPPSSSARPTSNGATASGSGQGSRTPTGQSRGDIIELSDDDDDDETDREDEAGSRGNGRATIAKKGEAICPMCDKVVPFITINPHIESGCKEYLEVPVKKPADSWSNLFGAANGSGAKKAKVGVGSASSSGPAKSVSTKEAPKDAPAPQRLSRPNYNLLSEKQLKAKLEEYSLSTLGRKVDLEARHRQWILIYNSNLDSQHPSKDSELRVEMRRWDADREREIKAKKKRAEKEPMDDETYLKTHASDFASLTKQVRDRAQAQKKRPREEAVDGHANRGR